MYGVFDAPSKLYHDPKYILDRKGFSTKIFIELPVSLQNLERLEVLHISGSQLDVFPEVICNLPALKKVIWRGGVTLWMQELSNDSTWRDRVFTEGIQMYDCESTSAPSEQTAEQT